MDIGSWVKCAESFDVVISSSLINLMLGKKEIEDLMGKRCPLIILLT